MTVVTRHNLEFHCVWALTLRKTEILLEVTLQEFVAGVDGSQNSGIDGFLVSLALF